MINVKNNRVIDNFIKDIFKIEKISFALLFLGISVISISSYFFSTFNSLNSYISKSYNYNCIKSLVVFIFALCIVICIAKFITKLSNENYYIIIFIAVSIFRFMFIIYFINYVVPFSDFLRCFNVANKIGDYSKYINYYFYNPGWSNFTTFEILLNRIGINKYYYLVIIEFIMSISIAFMLKKYSYLVTKNKNISYIASIMYLIYPSNLLYDFEFMPDTISLLLIVISSYIYIYIYMKELI